MKKRIIIALIITLTILILLNKYWLIFKPTHVSFNISGKDYCSISVILNKKNNNKFNKVKSDSINIDLNSANQIDLYIRKTTFPKRIKLTIDNIQTKENIYLSNIKIGKYKLEDLNAFEIEGAKAVTEDNKLIIKPYDSTIVLTYPNKLKARTTIIFDFKIFIIILVLSFLLFYKLTDYIAEFKTMKGKSRIDIIFLTLFFLFLFIPVFNINQDTISKKENRPLAKWQPLIKEDDEINFEFGKNFNNWFDDRFNMRNILIASRQKIDYYLSSMYYENVTLKSYLDKTNGWFFSYNEVNMNDSFILKEEKIKENLKLLNNLCKRNNIKLYVLITPSKEAVYYELVNKHHSYNPKELNDFMHKFIKETDANIIYPYNALRNAKDNDYVFFKSDHHWTDYGVFVSYNELKKYIKKDFPDFISQTSDDFNIINNNLVKEEYFRDYNYGATAERMGIHSKKHFNIDYKYYIHKDEANMQKFDEKNSLKRTFKYKNAKNKLKVVLYGNSMTENLTDIIPYDFQNLIKIRSNDGLHNKEDEFNINRIQKQCIEEKPDILLINIDVLNLSQFASIYNPRRN